MGKIKFFVISAFLFLSFSLTSCSSNVDNDFDARNVSVEQIQSALRSKAYASWDSQFVNQKTSWNNLDNKSPISSLSSENNDEDSQSLLSDAEVAAWRKAQADELEGLPTEQLGIMCEFFFQSFIQPKPGDDLGFTPIVERLKASGLTPYSVENVALLQDNRKTMKYPTENSPSFMLVCESDIKFRDTSGIIKRGKAYISWAYILVDGEAKFNFPYFTWTPVN